MTEHRDQTQGAERLLSVLAGERVLARAVTFMPVDVLEARYAERVASAPEALVALASDVDADVVFVSAAEPWAEDAARLLHEAGVAVAWVVSGVLGRVADDLGWPEVLRVSASDPSALAYRLASTLHDALVQARAGLTRGADMLVLADDLAFDDGWLVSPDFALDALVPCYRSVATEAAAAEVPVAFHSDGDIRTLLPALARAGFSAVHSGGIESARLSDFLDAAAGLGLVTIGGLPARGLLPEPLEAAGRAVALAERGWLVLADDGGISSAEELDAFVEAMRKITTA